MKQKLIEVLAYDFELLVAKFISQLFIILEGEVEVDIVEYPFFFFSFIPLLLFAFFISFQLLLTRFLFLSLIIFSFYFIILIFFSFDLAYIFSFIIRVSDPIF
jgi:hypothetical protein